MVREVIEQVRCSEAVGMVFGLEELMGQCCLTVFPEVRSGDILAEMICNWLIEGLAFPFRDGGNIHIGAAVEESVIASDTGPEIGLQVNSRFVEPQRLGVVDGGLSANEISGLVVLLDGVASEPVFDAGVIVVEPPKSLGC